MIEPNILAFQNAPLLEALSEPQHQGVRTVVDLAKRIGRDESNLRKTLKTLQAEGILFDDPLSKGLTEAGVDQLNAFRRAKHGGERRKSRGRWPIDQLRRNPTNREVRTEDVLDLADTMSADGVGDILMPLRLTPPDAHGVRMILAGERRWMAARLLRDTDRLPPALAEGLPFTEGEATEGEAALIAVVENSARADLTPWEDAQQLARAARLLNLNATELARRVGRAREGSRGGVRDVQDKIRLVRDATLDQIADYQRTGSWDAFRNAVFGRTPTGGVGSGGPAGPTTAAQGSAFDRRPPSKELSAMLAAQGAATTPRPTPLPLSITDPLVVNGVRYPNATRAADARRIASGERTQANYGSTPRPTPPDPVAPIVTPEDGQDIVTPEGGADRGLIRIVPATPREEPAPDPRAFRAGDPIQAALEELIEAIEDDMASRRRDVARLAADDPSLLESFDDDCRYLRDRIRRADVAIDDHGADIDAGHTHGEHIPAGSPVTVDGEQRTPAVAVRRSIRPDLIVCLDCGVRFVGGLRRHLAVAHQLTPADYRARWALPADYPMVAPNFAKDRDDMLRLVTGLSA